MSANKVFAFSSKFFVAPGKTELIKVSICKGFYLLLYLSFHCSYLQVTFNPLVTGTYKGVFQLFSSISGSLLGSVTLLGVAVSPHLQFLTSSEGRGGTKGEENDQHLIIDFGTCSSGCSSILPLYIVNHGETVVPVRLTLATVRGEREREGVNNIYLYLFLLYSPLSTGIAIQWLSLVIQWL